MFKTNCETTLVSQLLDSIDNHLDIAHLQMEHHSMSLDNTAADDDDEDDNDELWLSGHRSIFSSYGSHSRKTTRSFRQSQYDGFHWDLYENPNYHQFVFARDNKRTDSISQWSMDLNSDDDVDNPPQTSWQEIKTKSLSHSDHYLPNPLTLYHLFRRTKSPRQHPCRLYQNFSDRSTCDSLTSSSSSSSTNSSKRNSQIPMPRIKLKSPTTFSQIKLIKEQSKIGVDQCLQTSFIHPIGILSKSVDRLSTNPSQSSSSTTRQSLPDLDFLTYYAKENPTPLLTLRKSTSTAMKTPLIQPFSPAKKYAHTVFYCTLDIPSTAFPSSLPKRRTLKEIKRVKTTRTSPTMISAEENETYSSISSSSSSSGYFSNSSRHTQTPSLPYPLKSCLKRTKREELTKDILTSAIRSSQYSEDNSKHRRYSAPTASAHPTNSSDRTPTKICTLSEHDLRAKKSVSFCNEIARRLIISSTNSKDRYDFCDLIPRESLTDSPPNEFNLSDNDDEKEKEEEENQFINIIENLPEDPTKSLPIKYGSDQNLIHTFAKTILRILEIKCNDSKSFYLNNQTNHELDQTLRQDLCPLLREILEDGLRATSNSLFSKKINLWRLIELSTPTTGRLNEAKMKSQIALTSTTIDWVEKFNSFIYQLLNLHELTSWLTHFLSQDTLLRTYYEFWAFVLVNSNNDLLESITNQLEKLSPLSFRLKYNTTISLTNQRSILSKKCQVRTWLRDRKAQVKYSSKESSIASDVTIRRKCNSIPVTKRS